MGWKFWEGWGKKKLPKPETSLELANHLENMLDAQKKYNPDKGDITPAQTMLVSVEQIMKSFILDKKREQEEHQQDKAEFRAKFLELLKQMEERWKQKESQWTKTENQLILFYDYWYREVEIQLLQKQMSSLTLSTDKKEISEKLVKLIAINSSNEKGMKQRNIPQERIIELRKKLGIYEEK